MFGFALAMTVIFGTLVQDFSSPLSTMGALLLCLCGSSNLRPLLAVSRVFAVLFFVAFTIVFRFISTNMFLATQLNTFAALAGERDIDKAKKETAAKMGMKEVTYRNKRELQSELELELKADQVTLTKIWNLERHWKQTSKLAMSCWKWTGRRLNGKPPLPLRSMNMWSVLWHQGRMAPSLSSSRMAPCSPC